MTLVFRVLGPVEVTTDEGALSLSGKPLTLLACLLLRANTVVSVEALGRALWDDARDAPAGTKGPVQTYVMRLRRALGTDVIETVGTGYRLAADAGTLDLLRFTDLAGRGDAQLASGDAAAAATNFRAALDLWRGPALLDVPSETLHREDVAALAEQHLQVWERWADAQLQLGQTPIADLARLTTENPLRERFWEQSMLALYRSGRQADALAAYRQVAGTLAHELGLDPGPALQQLQQAILTGAPELDRPEAPGTVVAPPSDPTPVPRQLSAVADGFTGRDDELAQLSKLLGAASESSVTIAAIEGTAGVGKTAIGVRFAHEVTAAFPDGQVQLNLQGYGPGDPMAPATALESLLQSVGVTGQHVPVSVDARAALWRTNTAGRRMLIVLDNARNSEQVRPLLPGAGCMVLVTSRSQLRGLAAREGATRIALDRLSADDSLDLLSRIVGRQRARSDEAAGRRFVERCARLPLAIRILGEHANQQPDRSLADLVDELDAASDPLERFDLGDGAETDLREIFSRSYAALDDDAARMFRLLGLAPGQMCGVPAIAALAGIPVAEAERLVARLVGAYLIEQPRHGRYEFHDLLREFAADGARHESESDQHNAVSRLLDWYLYSALRATEAMRPGWGDALAEPSELGLPTIANHPEAMTWYAREQANLIAAVATAIAQQRHWYVCQLVLALRAQFNQTLSRDLWMSTHEAAIEAARLIGDRRAEGQLMCSLGVAHARFGMLDSAIGYCRSALTIAEEQSAPADEFSALNNLGNIYRMLSNIDRAGELARQALVVAEHIGDRRLLTIAWNNIADGDLAESRFGDALEHAGNALTHVDATLDPNGRATALLNLAAAQAGTGDYEASLVNCGASLELHLQAGDAIRQAEALEQMGDLHVQIDDSVRAAVYFTDAVELLVSLRHGDAERVRTKLAELADRP